MILDAIGKIGGVVGGIIDDLHTSDEERAVAKAKLEQILQAEKLAAMDHERAMRQQEVEIYKQQAEIIKADAAGESIVQRNWRPVAIFLLVLILCAHFMGWTQVDQLTEMEREYLMRIVWTCLGGVTLGKSVERVANQKWGDGLMGRNAKGKFKG